jgi:hypothetical protein
MLSFIRKKQASTVLSPGRPRMFARPVFAARIRKPVFGAVLAILAALALVPLAQPAQADDDAPLKRGGFQLSIEPESILRVMVLADGSGGFVNPELVSLHMKGKIDFKYRNGYVERAGLFAGYCARNDCGPFAKLLWYRSTQPDASSDGGGLPENDWHFDGSILTPGDRILQPTEQLAVVNRCKNNPQDVFFWDAIATLSVNTRTNDVSLGVNFIGAQDDFTSLDDVEFNGGDQSRDAGFTLSIKCEQLPAIVAVPSVPKTTDNQDWHFDQGPMKVNDIKLTLTTYSNVYSEPTPGTHCKKAKLRVTLETNQEGEVPFRLWKQRGDGEIKSEDIVAHAHHDEGFFFAVHERWISVDETTAVQFNARDLVNETFNKETGWKGLTLHCTGAGGGGLTTAPDDNDNNEAPEPSLAGNFQFLDNSPEAERIQCPRNANALIWFSNNIGENIHFSLDCDKLGSHSGVLQPLEGDDGHYTVATLVPLLPITESLSDSCTLRTVAPGLPRDHVTLERDFICATSTGQGAGTGLADPSTPDNPGTPDPLPLPSPAPQGTGTNLLPPMVCQGGTLSNGTCVCKSIERRIRLSPTAYRCVAIPKPPKPEVQKPVCKGGQVQGGKCRCGSGAERVKIGANTYQCQPKAKRTNPAQTAPKRTSPQKQKLVCQGGKISKGKCLCGANRKRIKLGKNSFACRKVATRTNQTKPKRVTEPKRVNPKAVKQKLVCKGGKVTGGKCRCGANRKRIKLGKNSFACRKVATRTNQTKPKRVTEPKRISPKVAKQKLVCKGGKVKGGKCHCGKGKQTVKRGPRRFACVARRN